MADHAQSAVELGGIVDVADHERTYNGFLALVKWGTIAVAILVALLFPFRSEGNNSQLLIIHHPTLQAFTTLPPL